MTTIYLVRHGQASFGAASYDQLSAKGEQQAQVVGDFFKQTLKKRLWCLQVQCNVISKQRNWLYLKVFMMRQFKQNRLGMSLIIKMCSI
jgi:hypothetical protein